jgi:putative ATP-binding cassette transporter
MDSRNPRFFSSVPFTKSHLKSFWKLGRSYWISKDGGSGRGLLFVVLLLTLGNVYLMVLVNIWTRHFYNAIQKFNESIFWTLLGYFLILTLLIVIVSSFQKYLVQSLQNQWRRWMTRRFLEQWLQNKSHYLWHLETQKTDNPDQRISDDIREFVTSSLSLFVGLINQVAMFVSFIAILWTLSGPLHISLGYGRILSIPGYMVWACLIYAGISTWIAHRIGRPLVGLNYNQQLLEADFRFSLIRLRENGENIALSDGEMMEETSLKKSFQHVFSNFQSIIQKMLYLDFFSSGYNQFSDIFPLVVAAPRYFTKHMGYGGLIQVWGAFYQVKGALSWILDNYAKLAYWSAVVDRLEGFECEVNRTKQAYQQAQHLLERNSEQSPIQIKAISILAPNSQKVLVSMASQTLYPGESVMMKGPSGCGKSTLIRVLKGIWPYAQGRVIIPSRARMMFIPQKIYLPIGTLKATLTYPKPETDFSHEAVKKVLTLCQLDYLKYKLEECQHWEMVLSIGEQQRIAWGRVFLYQPEWVIMDEATSALEEELQAYFYQLIQQQFPHITVIGTAHQQNPEKFFTKVWNPWALGA